MGAQRVSTPGKPSAGAAFVFVNDGAWELEASLVSSDTSAQQLFGTSVSISGDTIVVGAMTSSDSGAAYVFVRQGTNWSEQAKLVPSDGGSAATSSGNRWEVSGDTILVGATRNDAGKALTTNEGAAYVFERSGTTWTELTKWTASVSKPQSGYGRSVGIDGDLAVVGAHTEDFSGSYRAGAAYVYRNGPTGWAEEERLVESLPVSGNWFGRSVPCVGRRPCDQCSAGELVAGSRLRVSVRRFRPGSKRDASSATTSSMETASVCASTSMATRSPSSRLPTITPELRVRARPTSLRARDRSGGSR